MSEGGRSARSRPILSLSCPLAGLRRGRRDAQGRWFRRRLRKANQGDQEEEPQGRCGTFM